MIITPEIIAAFRAFYPEFASDEYAWDDDTLEKFLYLGDDETGSARWGSYTSTATPYTIKKRGMFAYAAHRATLDNRSTNIALDGGIASGAARVASKSVGDESVSFAVSSPDHAQSIGVGDLNTTTYGMEYLRLRKRAGMGAVVV